MGESMQGLLAIDGGFALRLENGTVCDRRLLDASAVAALKGFTDRYSELLNAASPEADLLALGRDLYAWLDGDSGHLQVFLRHAARPLRFEVGAAIRRAWCSYQPVCRRRQGASRATGRPATGRNRRPCAARWRIPSLNPWSIWGCLRSWVGTDRWRMRQRRLSPPASMASWPIRKTWLMPWRWRGATS